MVISVVLIAWPTSAQAPPPATAMTIATTWATPAPRVPWNARRRNFIRRLSRAVGTDPATTSGTETSSTLSTGAASGTSRMPTMTGTKANIAPPSTKAAVRENQNPVVSTRWSGSSAWTR